MKKLGKLKWYDIFSIGNISNSSILYFKKFYNRENFIILIIHAFSNLCELRSIEFQDTYIHLVLKF